MVLREAQVPQYLDRVKRVVGTDLFQNPQMELIYSMLGILKGLAEVYPASLPALEIDLHGFPELRAWRSDVGKAIVMYKEMVKARQTRVVPIVDELMKGNTAGVRAEVGRAMKLYKGEEGLTGVVTKMTPRKLEWLGKWVSPTRLSFLGFLREFPLVVNKSNPRVLYLPAWRSPFYGDEEYLELHELDRKNVKEELGNVVAAVAYADPEQFWDKEAGEEEFAPFLVYFDISDRRVTFATRSYWNCNNNDFPASHPGFWRRNDNREREWTDNGSSAFERNSLEMTKGKRAFTDEIQDMLMRVDYAFTAVKDFRELSVNLNWFDELMKELADHTLWVMKGGFEAAQLESKNEAIIVKLEKFYGTLTREKVKSTFLETQRIIVEQVKKKVEEERNGKKK